MFFTRDNRQTVFGPTKVTVLDHPPCSPDLASADYFFTQKWNPIWRGVSLTRFLTSRKPWQVH